MTQHATLAIAADYADAMLVARRAKNWLFLLLLLFLLSHIGIFLVARFVSSVHLAATVQSVSGSTATTQLAVLPPPSAEPTPEQRVAAPLIRYALGVTNFLCIVLVLVLAVVLLLIVGIMLVGRLVGVTHLTSAFVWCVLLVMMLIPWQSMFNSELRSIRLLHDWRGHSTGEVIATDASAASALIDAGAAENAATTLSNAMPDVRVPGILYTWPELSRDYDFSNKDTRIAVLKWARFVGFPALAVIILLMIQSKSSRGLRFALGEAEMQVNVTGALA
jgi:hypothetical protein